MSADTPERDTGRVSIAVVVVNWRNVSDTVQCLESLADADPRPSRVVVIDNGSADHSIDRLLLWADQYGVCFELLAASGEVCRRSAEAERPTASSPWLSLVSLTANLGFAGGNNVGLALLVRDTSVTHFLLLNNDAVVSPSYFAEMRAALSRRPRAGLSTGTIYELANRSRVWYAGGRMLPLRALVTHELRVPAHEFPVQTEFVTGCAMVISRAAIEEVGMLAECYFPGYMEDAEYSWRIRSSGFELIYAPRAVVYHKVGTTFGARAVSTLTAYHQNRHRLYFVRRNLCGLSRITAMVYMIVTKPGRALIDLIQGRPDVGWAALRGTWAGLTTTPGDSARGSRESADLLRTRDNASR